MFYTLMVKNFEGKWVNFGVTTDKKQVETWQKAIFLEKRIIKITATYTNVMA